MLIRIYGKKCAWGYHKTQKIVPNPSSNFELIFRITWWSNIDRFHSHDFAIPGFYWPKIYIRFLAAMLGHWTNKRSKMPALLAAPAIPFSESCPWLKLFAMLLSGCFSNTGEARPMCAWAMQKKLKCKNDPEATTALFPQSTNGV